MTTQASPLASEADLMRAYIEAIPFAIPTMRVFRRNIIAARLNGGHFVRAGIPGQCDLYGYVKSSRPAVSWCWAHPIEIECKAARTRWTKGQKKWRAFCEEWRIPYLALEARKDETPGDTVGRWVKETMNYVGTLA